MSRWGRFRAYVPQFLVAPSIVATTNLVLTTGRRIAERFAPALGLEIFPVPMVLKPFTVRMVWHPRTEDDSVGRWLRSLVQRAVSQLLESEKSEARSLRRRAPRSRGRNGLHEPATSWKTRGHPSR